MTLTFKEVAEILKIVDASSCEEVVLDLAGVRLEIRRGRSSGGAEPARPSSPVSRAAAAPTAVATAAAAATTAVRAEAGTVEIRAPMVGTFYRRPAPGEKPFVEPGQRVRKGEPLALIEVMKLYTTIEAPADGIVEAVVADDAALVEFDTLLMVLRPA
jgi:acetyl-CoA carboxylase biotin carboxyl carrier protein